MNKHNPRLVPSFLIDRQTFTSRNTAPHSPLFVPTASFPTSRVHLDPPLTTRPTRSAPPPTPSPPTGRVTPRPLRTSGAHRTCRPHVTSRSWARRAVRLSHPDEAGRGQEWCQRWSKRGGAWRRESRGRGREREEQTERRPPRRTPALPQRHGQERRARQGAGAHIARPPSLPPQQQMARIRTWVRSAPRCSPTIRPPRDRGA